MRKMVAAPAARGSAADKASASIPTVAKARLFPHFTIRISANPLLDFR
jgi:hypothetical protein